MQGAASSGASRDSTSVSLGSDWTFGGFVGLIPGDRHMVLLLEGLVLDLGDLTPVPLAVPVHHDLDTTLQDNPLPDHHHHGGGRVVRGLRLLRHRGVQDLHTHMRILET